MYRLCPAPPALCPPLQLYLHHLDSTCGAGGLPAGVVRVLNSKACRSAVMFGDSLEEGQVGLPSLPGWHCQAFLPRESAAGQYH